MFQDTFFRGEFSMYRALLGILYGITNSLYRIEHPLNGYNIFQFPSRYSRDAQFTLTNGTAPSITALMGSTFVHSTP